MQLEACNSRWCPWDESLDPEKQLHFLVTEVGLYVRIQEHLTRHNFVITLSTSSNPDMVKTMPFEVHLLLHIETIELLGRIETIELLGRMYREYRSLKAELEALKQEARQMRRTFGADFESFTPWNSDLIPLLGLLQPVSRRQSLMHRHRFIVTDGASIFQQLFSSHRTHGHHLWLLFSF